MSKYRHETYVESFNARNFSDIFISNNDPIQNLTDKIFILHDKLNKPSMLCESDMIFLMSTVGTYPSSNMVNVMEI